VWLRTHRRYVCIPDTGETVAYVSTFNELKKYLYELLARYISLVSRAEDRLVDVDPLNELLADHLAGRKAITSKESAEILGAEYVLLNGNLHFERDVHSYLAQLRGRVSNDARLIVVYYSALWRPVLQVATRLGFRTKTPEVNWLAPNDVDNFLALTGWESIRRESKVLVPVMVPVISELINRYLAPLPVVRQFCMLNVQLARPRPKSIHGARSSVSVVIPARNEAGNIEAIVQRLPRMSEEDELIFVEGGSTDQTWEVIKDVQRRYSGERRVLIAQQDGKGKGDAVRKGFAMSSGEILMILDADMTVPPEELPKFFAAIKDGTAEFVNGSRLVYPMEREAMRFLNMMANKFFAVAFTFLLGQRLKDTLCGTKVISRANYLRIVRNRGHFGDFDPFGDFDLLFGAARMGLKIVELPIAYRERTYGTTNISRWKHGALLLAMLLIAAKRLKFT
jgi:GT2 family glycosyltransferase